MRQDETAAARYAQGLFQAAFKADEVGKVGRDLKDVVRIFKSSGLKSALENPRFPSAEKESVITAVGKKLQSPLTGGFLKILLRKSRVGIIYGAARRYEELWHEAEKISAAEVILPGEPNKVFLAEIQKSLARLTGKTVQMTVKVDPDMIGGMRIKIGNRLIDGSVRSQLGGIKKKLLETQMN